MIHDFILHYRAWAFSRLNADLDRTFDDIQAKLKAISAREEGLGQFAPQTSPRNLTFSRQYSPKSLELCARRPNRTLQALIVPCTALIVENVIFAFGSLKLGQGQSVGVETHPGCVNPVYIFE